ncbi:unnamed protein product [Arabidopsis halleri]
MVIQDKSTGKWHQANLIGQLPDVQFRFSLTCFISYFL